jgi:hypothetical protein
LNGWYLIFQLNFKNLMWAHRLLIK